MDCPTQTIRTQPVVTLTQPAMNKAPVSVALQENVNKMHELYQHALEAQANLVFSAWINSQRAVLEAQIEKRNKQIAWALRGGPLRRRSDRAEDSKEPLQQDTV